MEISLFVNNYFITCQNLENKYTHTRCNIVYLLKVVKLE